MNRIYGSMGILALALLTFLFAGPLMAMGRQGPGRISPREAKAIIDAGKNHVLMDVRTQDEHIQRRIPNSILLPYTLITEESASALIPSSDSLIILYCRTGRRSAIAAESLRNLGYTQVYDLGGINSWPYETESGAL